MGGPVGEIERARRVLELMGQGSGTSSAVVKVLRDGEDEEADAARRILLGYPPEVSLRGLASGDHPEVGMITRLVAESTRTDTKEMGLRGSALSELAERWLKEEDSRRMLQKVYRFRGLVICAVLGAVTGMIAGVAPLIELLGALAPGGAAPQGGNIDLLGGVLTLLSSAALGQYMGGRSAVWFSAVGIASYLIVLGLAAPLGGIEPALGTGG